MKDSRYLKSLGSMLSWEKQGSENVGSGTWIDCGTPESLLNASLMALEGEISTEL